MVWLTSYARKSSYPTTCTLKHGLWNLIAPQASGGFTVVGELPTTIGGLKAGQVTNEIVSLVDGWWTETFPSMPTPRIYSSAVVYQDHLIVAGGSASEKLGGDVLSVVEVMDINNCQSDQAWNSCVKSPASSSRSIYSCSR